MKQASLKLLLGKDRTTPEVCLKIVFTKQTFVYE